jgi:predicted DNA-binding transcriptional regulator YafY
MVQLLQEVRRKFMMTFPDMPVPNRTIYKDIKRLQTLLSILDSRKIRGRYVLGKLDETGARLDTCKN